MSRRVDKLFGGTPGLGRPSRAKLARGLLIVAIPMDLLGLISCLSVPGALLTLAAWQVAEGDMQRIEAGELSVEHAPELARLKQVATWAMIGCAAVFMLQLWLLSTGRYQDLLAWLL